MSDLLEKALDAHGGLDLWRSFSSLEADVKATGALFQFKQQTEALHDTTVRIDTRRPHTTFSPIGMPGLRGVFEGDGRVLIESDAGKVLEQRPAPRSAMLALPADQPWDLMHILYFGGYAQWNYLSTPFMFTLPGFETREVEPWQEGEETWRRLHVRFSPDVPTHCAEQTFYFDESGLLRRLDYASEVISSNPAAHYLYDYAEFSGLRMATRRKALRRNPDGTAAPEPVFVGIEYTDIRLS